MPWLEVLLTSVRSKNLLGVDRHVERASILLDLSDDDSRAGKSREDSGEAHGDDVEWFGKSKEDAG